MNALWWVVFGISFILFGVSIQLLRIGNLQLLRIGNCIVRIANALERMERKDK